MTGFTFIDVLLLFGISLGLFLASALIFIKKNNTGANKILALLLVISVIMLLGRLFFLSFFHNVILFRIGTTVDFTVFLFGPLILMFLRKLLFNELLSNREKFYFFIPALLYLGYALWTFSLGSNTYYKNVISGKFHNYFFYIELLGITTNMFFIYHSLKVVNSYKSLKNGNISFDQNIVKFTSLFLGAYTLSISLWLVSFINLYFFKNRINIISYDLVWISIPVFIYIIGIYLLSQPEIFRLSRDKSERKIKTKRLNDSKIQLLESKLKSLINQNHIYRNSDLTLVELASAMKCSTNDLSWLINTHFNTSFYEYINNYRIKEFLELIEKGFLKTHTISAISVDVGFQSKSTFYKAFRMVTGTTPSNYIKNIKT